MMSFRFSERLLITRNQAGIHQIHGIILYLFKKNNEEWMRVFSFVEGVSIDFRYDFYDEISLIAYREAGAVMIHRGEVNDGK